MPIVKFAGTGTTDRVRPIFDDRVLAYLSDWHDALRCDAEAKTYTELMAFAFWIRPQRLRVARTQYAGERRYGRGIAFHIAPGNVPMNALYTFVFGLLSGTPNRVRLPSKEAPALECALRILRKTLENYPDIAEENLLMRYPHDDDVTRAFSAEARVRVIWGGDDTIRTIEKAPLPVRSVEIKFADRVSLAVVGDDYLTYPEEKRAELARHFYNDTYLSDGLACSSPAVVAFVGTREETVRTFFEALAPFAAEYPADGVRTVRRLTALYAHLAKTGEEVLYENRNLVVARAGAPDPDTYRGKFGLFYAVTVPDLDALEPYLTTRVQTVLYTGMDASGLAKCVAKGVPGVDRIVPFGHALEMDFHWDGYDMIRTMSRFVEVME